jgi:hypothetical protein
MRDRYRALRVVVTLLRAFAWIVAIFGTLVVIAAALTATAEGGSGPQDWLRGLGIAGAGVLAVALQALVLFAASAMITLFIDIEQNTRATAEMMAHLMRPTDTEPLG